VIGHRGGVMCGDRSAKERNAHSDAYYLSICHDRLLLTQLTNSRIYELTQFHLSDRSIEIRQFFKSVNP
jgi:hypothetical protein